MRKPETILAPRKARILISEATLPKNLVSNRDQFWRMLNALLTRCLTACGVTTHITLGENEKTFLAWGYPSSAQCPFEDEEDWK